MLASKLHSVESSILNNKRQQTTLSPPKPTQFIKEFYNLNRQSNRRDLQNIALHRHPKSNLNKLFRPENRTNSQITDIRRDKTISGHQIKKITLPTIIHYDYMSQRELPRLNSEFGLSSVQQLSTDRPYIDYSKPSFKIVSNASSQNIKKLKIPLKIKTIVPLNVQTSQAEQNIEKQKVYSAECIDQKTKSLIKHPEKVLFFDQIQSQQLYNIVTKETVNLSFREKNKREWLNRYSIYQPTDVKLEKEILGLLPSSQKNQVLQILRGVRSDHYLKMSTSKALKNVELVFPGNEQLHQEIVDYLQNSDYIQIEKKTEEVDKQKLLQMLKELSEAKIQEKLYEFDQKLIKTDAKMAELSHIRGEQLYFQQLENKPPLTEKENKQIKNKVRKSEYESFKELGVKALYPHNHEK